jgi:hypothetical protein
MELRGEMNVQVTDPAQAHLRITLASPSTDFGGSNLHFKQHPRVAKFTPGEPRVIALNDSSKALPVGRSLAVLKWGYTGTDESNVPLSIYWWPSPSDDGTCEMSFGYELLNQNVTLYDVVISIPLPDGSHPIVTSHSGEWALSSAPHSLAWSIPVVSAANDSRAGSLIFNIGDVDLSAFFPINVSFIGRGSLAGVAVASVDRVDGAEGPEYSVDAVVTVDKYLVV